MGCICASPADVLIRCLSLRVYLFQPKRDATDAAIAVFTAHKHQPASSTHQVTLQGVVYQLDAALQNPVTQKAGIVFIYDMSNSKYSNFDYDLSQKILPLFKVSKSLRNDIGDDQDSALFSSSCNFFNCFIHSNDLVLSACSLDLAGDYIFPIIVYMNECCGSS